MVPGDVVIRFTMTDWGTIGTKKRVFSGVYSFDNLLTSIETDDSADSAVNYARRTMITSDFSGPKLLQSIIENSVKTGTASAKDETTMVLFKFPIHVKEFADEIKIELMVPFVPDCMHTQ